MSPVKKRTRKRYDDDDETLTFICFLLVPTAIVEVKSTVYIWFGHFYSSRFITGHIQSNVMKYQYLGLLQYAVVWLALQGMTEGFFLSPLRKCGPHISNKIPRCSQTLHFRDQEVLSTSRKKVLCQDTRGLLEGDPSGDALVHQLADRRSASGGLILLAPAITACIAFFTYKDISQGFHTAVDVLSGHTWEPVDGGAYLTDLITPALTGPVASFISLLFGTLTSMTVGTLYNRQAALAKLLGELLEDLRLLEVHLETLPTELYRRRGRRLNQAYGSLLVEILEDTNLTPSDIKRRREAGRRILESQMKLLHKVSGDATIQDDINGRGLDECYMTVNRMIRTRSSMVSTYENRFPIWHYGNLCILAVAILFIFLVLTDKTALAFLGGFQLRLCWSMLIGTLSMLVAVVYDLNNPLTGTFQILRPMQLEEFDLDDFIESRH